MSFSSSVLEMLLGHGNIFFSLVLIFILLVAHHHLAELVKVHGAGSVLVDLVDDAVQVLGGQPRVKLGDDLAQLAGGDEAGAVPGK